MQAPLQITLRDIDRSEAVEQRIRQKAKKLDTFSGQIISCHVVVELTQRHKHQGKLYNVRITLALPHKELVVNRNAQEDLYVSIRDAFDDMLRQLDETVSKKQGEVKAHPQVIHGRIARLFKDQDFGFIEAVDGEEYYFNAASVAHPSRFDRLAVGMEVHFIEAMGDEGLQARRVSAKGHAE